MVFVLDCRIRLIRSKGKIRAQLVSCRHLCELQTSEERDMVQKGGMREMQEAPNHCMKFRRSKEFLKEKALFLFKGL